ncbi:MAG: carboxylesterase/lipase family protein [Ruminococcus sp.]|nr:carboxylesterase/lipase family protein [Ruminococcus sp.]
MAELKKSELIRASYGINLPLEGEVLSSSAAVCRNGTFVGKTTGDILAFRGIPYAKPPVGERRWKRPVPVDTDSGVYEAYYNGKSPIQTEWETEQASYYPQGEDCLYLNIWLNKSCSETDKPVIVFLHGGAYGWGGTADPLYDGANFVRHNPDIVLVTVGYRTGLMGFVDLSYLKGGEFYPDAPNLGLLDQIEALRWVQKNIAAFGGDPDNVTICGESAGGGSVSLFPIIGEAKGLFRRVIAESGSVALTFSKEQCKAFTKRLMRESGLKTMDELTALSEDDLKRLNKKLNYYNNFPQRDGMLIPLDPYRPYEIGATSDIDILIGTNSDEANYWVGEIGGIVPYRFSIPVKYENDLKTLTLTDRKRVKSFMSSLSGHSIWRMSEFYDEMMFRLPAIKQAQSHVQNGGKVFMYYWTQPSSVKYRGACHAVELAYVFGNLDETIFTGERGSEELSRTVMTMWANFARTGDPSAEGLAWLPYDADRRSTMVISAEPEMYDDVLSEQRKLLFPLLRYMINPSYAELDYNVPFVRKTAGLTAAAAVSAVALVIGIVKLFKDD